ncbi:T9SS type A sorting domain-containing protein [Flavobacterium psychrotolerans]|nr:T9SS type A sorting domain-containing protein [Flavobacterium psychrotolerans]
MILILFSAISYAQQINPYKAPLYWNPYEYHIIREQNGIPNNYIPENELLANINWVDSHLKSHGFNMICTDGWGDTSQLNVNGYRKSHSVNWVHDFAWWSAELQSRGMTLGIYHNPLWINVDKNDTSTLITGTNIPVSSLMDSNENALWFKWVHVDRPGAEAYVKGCVQYYADMGVKYLRVDFLSWFETGYDRNMGTVGPSRPHSEYVTALKWMREACDANGVYLSLVMPSLNNNAEEEKIYGHLFRINGDAGSGSWYKFSDEDRGIHYTTWSQYATAFDGFVYWSQMSGKNLVQLDGDFIRLNTFANDDEKRSIVSLNLLAGGPVAIADQYSSIGNDLWLYQNDEMLALNTDKFVAHPLSNDPLNDLSQTWKGQLSNGDWVIGFFNRETTSVTRSMNFSSLGITGNVNVHDLWQHTEMGGMSSISVTVPPHGCAIYKLAAGATNCTAQSITFNVVANQVYGGTDFSPSTTASSGLPIAFEVASGPATIVNNQIHLTGLNGTVYVQAKQAGDATYCAAIPAIQSFQVSGGHQTVMYTAGTFDGWSLKPMTFVNDEWVIENVAITAGAHQLKFANTGNWTGIDWGIGIGLTGTAAVSTGGAANISFTATTSGTYSIHFNDITLQYSIVYTVNHQTEMYAAGTFSNWGLAPMTLVNGVWELQNVALAAGTYELKFANTNNFTGIDWGNNVGLVGTAQVTTGGSANISFTIPSAGTYSITFNDINLDYALTSTLGVTGETLEGFNLYPNPAKSSITLHASQTIQKAVITDMTGRKITEQALNCTDCSVDVSFLPNGIYVITAISGEAVAKEKLIVERK